MSPTDDDCPNFGSKNVAEHAGLARVLCVPFLPDPLSIYAFAVPGGITPGPSRRRAWEAADDYSFRSPHSVGS